MSRRFASIPDAAVLCGVSYGSVRNRIRSRDLTAYRLPNRRGHFVDLDEARAVFSQRGRYATFGPDAKLKDLSNVLGADFEVVSA